MAIPTKEELEAEFPTMAGMEVSLTRGMMVRPANAVVYAFVDHINDAGQIVMKLGHDSSNPIMVAYWPHDLRRMREEGPTE